MAGLARKVRRDGPPGLGPVDHGGNPVHIALCKEGEINERALRLLTARDKGCRKVEIVLRDGIVYRDKFGRLVTTWVVRDGKPEGPQRVQVLATEPGMPAFPS